MKTRFFTTPIPRLIAHRGFSGRYPENTLPAFQAAVDAGISYLELDVWLSRDGHPVVHHDRTCRRTCGDPRAITELSLAELNNLDAGRYFSVDGGRTYPFRGLGVAIPSLKEILTAFPETFFTIEVKEDAPRLEAVLLDTIRACGREDAVLIASAVDQFMVKVRRYCSGIPTGCSRSEAAGFFLAVQKGAFPDRLPAEVLHLPLYYGGMKLISPQLVQAARAIDLEVHVWTVNDACDMKSLFEMGVAGITSDFPDLLLEVGVEFKDSNL